MKVVPDRPFLALAIRAGAVCSLLITAVAAYYLGFRNGIDINGDARLERSNLRGVSSRQEDELEALRSQLLFAEQAARVDRESMVELQEELFNQREQIKSLEQDLVLYRGVMDPDSDEGLTIGRINVAATETGSTFAYRIELLQPGSNQKDIEGTVTLSLSGSYGEGKTAEILLADEGTESQELDFGFRFFTNVEGRLVLPEGFIAENLTVRARITGEDEVTERTMDWHSVLSPE